MTRRSPASSDPGAQRSADIIPLRVPETDAGLVRALQVGEAQAGAALFDRYAPLVRRVLARVLGPDPELGDLLQDVFVAALASIHRLDQPGALRAWLTQTAVYTARARIRRRARWRFLRFVPDDELPDHAGAEFDAEGGEALAAVYRVLGLLPPDERIAFALRVLDGMELVGVASACGVSLATIKRRLTSAQRRFVELSQHEPVLVDWLTRSTP